MSNTPFFLPSFSFYTACRCGRRPSARLLSACAARRRGGNQGQLRGAQPGGAVGAGGKGHVAGFAEADHSEPTKRAASGRELHCTACVSCGV